MQRESKKYLWDVARAAGRIQEFARGKTFADYEADVMLRSAVERQFTIIGEALSQLAKIDAKLAAKVREYQQIIAFRNIIIHGYASLRDDVVWLILTERLGDMKREVEQLLDEP